MISSKRYQVKKVYTAFTGIPAFQKIKLPTKQTGAEVSEGPPNLDVAGIIFILNPGNSFIAGGFWGPNAEDLKRIRDEIAFDASPLRKILKSKSFISTFSSLQGEQLKTSPKGFDAGNDAIDLLRFKQFLVMRKFTDGEVLSETFLKEAGKTFKNMRPFFDYMSGILSTDNNGIKIH